MKNSYHNIARKIKLKSYYAYLKIIKYPFWGFYFRKIAKLSNVDILNPEQKYFLGALAIMRGEDDYLVEWMEFHILMGVEHFILYNNGDFGKTNELLKNYINDGIVTHIAFPDIPEMKFGVDADAFSIQQLAYGDCIKRFKKHFNFLLRIDIDEFIFPLKHKSISDFLINNDPHKIQGIEVNWQNFGYCNHDKKPKGLVIENYTSTSREIDFNTVKSICNTKYLSNFFKYTSAHEFSYRLSFIDIFTKIFFGYPKMIRKEKANHLFQLNHYITKSKDEFLRKGKINKSGFMTGKETIERFNEINKTINEVENRKILKFLPLLKNNTSSN